MTCEPFFRGLALALSLLVLGCSPPSNEAPPLTDGVYIVRGICFGEGGCNRHWRASAAVPLHERPDPASPIVATLASGEWVDPVDGQYRFVPLRGVVHTATTKPPLAVGDVVYRLQPLGEGFYAFWHKGQTPEHDWAEGDPNEPIKWDEAPQDPPGVVLGWWVQLWRANGQTGWVKEPSSFECMGSLQGSANCRD
jgi:hypothetical protein